MADNFNTLYNRLLSRAPLVGPLLAQQFINDAWQTLQSRREWSWRRRNGVIAPASLYQTGTVTTNASTSLSTGSGGINTFQFNQTQFNQSLASGISISSLDTGGHLITGTGTAWTQSMVGLQIRLAGYLTPYYTIVAVLSPTALVIDLPWAGPNLVDASYQIIQLYIQMPSDFGYWYSAVSIKDGYRIWTDITEADVNLLDPQRTNQGQTYAFAFKDYGAIYGGIIGQPIASRPGASVPVSTTSYGFTYPADTSYIVQVTGTGLAGTATYKWLRSGQSAFSGQVTTSQDAQDLSDGVQLYWPGGVNYIAGDVYIINCESVVTTNGPRYELWPAPTISTYLYPYIYIAREYALSPTQPALPPYIANRGEVLLEMGLEKCAEWPGPDVDHPNPYFNLTLAKMHATKAEMLLWDLERNDEEIGVTNVTYQSYPMYPAPWLDGSWQASHAPFLRG